MAAEIVYKVQPRPYDRFLRASRYGGAMRSTVARGATHTVRVHARSWMIEAMEQRLLLSVAPVAPEFEYTDSTQRTYSARIAADAGGNFVAAWYAAAMTENNWGIYFQRFNPAGSELTPEVRIADGTTADVAATRDGSFVIVWRGVPARRHQTPP